MPYKKKLNYMLSYQKERQIHSLSFPSPFFVQALCAHFFSFLLTPMHAPMPLEIFMRCAYIFPFRYPHPCTFLWLFLCLMRKAYISPFCYPRPCTFPCPFLFFMRCAYIFILATHTLARFYDSFFVLCAKHTFFPLANLHMAFFTVHSYTLLFLGCCERKKVD